MALQSAIKTLANITVVSLRLEHQDRQGRDPVTGENQHDVNLRRRDMHPVFYM